MNYFLMHPKYGYVVSVSPGCIAFSIYYAGAMKMSLEMANHYKFNMTSTGYILSELQIVPVEEPITGNA